MNIQPDSSIAALQHLLSATSARHRVLANNLANSDTPGFIRQDISFDQALTDAVQSGDYSSFNLPVQADKTDQPRADGNNVSVERELSELNKNAMLHQTGLQLLQSKLAMERLAITGKT